MYEYNAKVIRVVDADTLDLEVDLGMDIRVRQRVRLFGINAPEVRGPSREAGQAATAQLVEWLTAANNEVVVRTHKDKRGKYGRYLVDVLVPQTAGDARNLNQDLVDQGHAVPYFP